MNLLRKIKDRFTVEEAWGIYSFYPQGKEKLVDNTDLRKIEETEALPRFGHVYRCCGYNPFSDYIQLEYKQIVFRAKPSNFKQVPAPRLRLGDKVLLRKKPDEVRTVIDLLYHFNRRTVVYRVSSPNGAKNYVYWFYEQLELVSIE
jgi:hypothetical protein